MGFKILFLTKYSDLGASSRLRTLQYLNYLNFDYKLNSLFSNEYINSLYNNKGRIFIIIICYIKRILFLIKNKHKLIYIEKEMFPFLPFFFEFFFLRKRKFILDFDDAIFHNYENHKFKLVRILFKNKIPKLISKSSLVIAGNEYIRDYALKCNAKRVEILPTSVNVKKYNSNNFKHKNNFITIGWIGSPSTKSYLSIIHDPMKFLSEKFNIKLKLIGINDYFIDGVNIECKKWTESSEADLLDEIDIGIMPLPDRPFERGKCGYKLIQYGACSKPSIASPVGANVKIIKHGINGYLAYTKDDWTRYLTKLINDKSLTNKLGSKARFLVEKKYSVQENSKKLKNIISYVK